jgi:hypothetical protein
MFQRNMTLILVALGINAVIAAIQSNATSRVWFTRRLEKSKGLEFHHHQTPCGRVHSQRSVRSVRGNWQDFFTTNLEVRVQPLRFVVDVESIRVGRRCGFRAK